MERLSRSDCGEVVRATRGASKPQISAEPIAASRQE